MWGINSTEIFAYKLTNKKVHRYMKSKRYVVGIVAEKKRD